MHARRVVTVTITVAALLSGTLASAAPATASPTKQPARYYVRGPVGAATPGVGEDPTDAELLDAGTIGLCNIGLGDVSVQSWDDTAIGHVDLFCGDDASGYIHIRDGDGTPDDPGHEADWQTLVDSFGGGDWDDFMVYATGEAITQDRAPDDHGNDKLCFTAPIEIYKTDGTYIGTWNPTIIVSANNRRVITSYPTGFQSDC